MLSLRVTASSASLKRRSARRRSSSVAAAPAFSSSAWRCASARRLAAASPADCADAALTLAAVAVSCRRAMAASMTSRRSPLAAAFSSRARRASRSSATRASSPAMPLFSVSMAARWSAASRSMLSRPCPARSNSDVASSMRNRLCSLSFFRTAISLSLPAFASVMARMSALACSTASTSCWASARRDALFSSNSSSWRLRRS